MNNKIELFKISTYRVFMADIQDVMGSVLRGLKEVFR